MYEKIDQFIDIYEKNFDYVNNSHNKEYFKLEGFAHFRKQWNPNAENFAKMFSEARKKCFVMIDNSRISPTSGVIKLAEKYPDKIRSLFTDVLLAEDNGDLRKRQDNIDTFVEEINSLLQEVYPGSWKYKNDRHSASCYLAMVKPTENFIYRYSDAETFAVYNEFGMDIGAGENFSLANYYKLCETIVEKLKQHTTLLEKYRDMIRERGIYEDNELHVLAFDLMYCCRTYNFYNGFPRGNKQKAVKQYKLDQAKETARKEREEKLRQIEAEIHEFELAIDDYKSISLLGVEVHHNQYGTGKVVSQDVNYIEVQFETAKKQFQIHKQFKLRPTFENDEEIVEAFSDYSDKMKQLERLYRERALAETDLL